ncbi:hypothetical protein [Streptomyces collinus]|uniref:hypothetical protein n=1 Tax=Streptomyces collinus TaxID=42684 RepID=UPI00294286F7|nr:hypothetical protein [Streptomyces collinus]
MIQVRQALTQAGYHLVEEDDTRTQGLRVREVPDGAMVTWSGSDAFTALASDQHGATSYSLRAIVQVAVSGLLLHQGQTVTETADENALLVTAPDTQPTRA